MEREPAPIVVCILAADTPFLESPGHHQLMQARDIAETAAGWAYINGQDMASALLAADAEAIRMEMTSSGGVAR